MLPKTDIVITYRSTREFPTEGYLKQCVDSVVENTSACYRFIFVDDNSDVEGRGFLQEIADLYPTSILIQTRMRNWFTRASNIGLRHVRTHKAVLLNSDTICRAGWLKELYDVWDEVEMETQRRVGLVGSVLSRQEQRRYELSPAPGYVTGHCWLLSMPALSEAADSRGTPGEYLDTTNVDMAHIRSDIEICTMLRGLGYLCVNAFKSEVDHLGGKSWGMNLQNLWPITPQYLRCLDGKD